MAYTNYKKSTGKDSNFKWVRSIYGKGDNAQQQYNYIPSAGMNEVIKDWHDRQSPREFNSATPSRLLTCPRVAWLTKHNVPATNETTWAMKQRMLLGRLFENQFAEQLKDVGQLLYHWKDDDGVEVTKFATGENETLLTGVPDYLIKVKDKLGNEVIAISDAKTSRSDSFGYLPISDEELFTDWGYYKYRMQLTAYYLLAHTNKDWFKKNNLPLPTHLHLFTYALDDGIVRRELLWQPTEEDIVTVMQKVRLINEALVATEMPECTCTNSFDNFDVKFCKYGVKVDGSKIAETCCADSLSNLVNKGEIK